MTPASPQTELAELLPRSQYQALDAANVSRLLQASPYALSVFRRDPDLGDWLLEHLPLAHEERLAGLRERWAGLLEEEEEADFMRGLRLARHRELLLILWRDLLGRDELPETMAALSRLADCLIALAHDWCRARLVRRFGEPRDEQGASQHMVVLGLGKLGGGELNVSSDVDLIFAFPETGETDGSKSVDNESFFTRLGRQLIRVLDEVTAEGQVYRVDMRLRPFGASGPLVMNFDGMETYYQLHGREWERYALIKARPVAGDIEAGEGLLRTLQPFVYRRYLDYSVFGSLRDMKQGIRREVRRQGLEDNIKLGRGGIREIEFIVQLYQLIRGGREAELRCRSLLEALEAVTGNEHLTAEHAAELREHYLFLRRLENRIQGMHDAQTHDLPSGEEDRQRLLIAMGMEDWAQLDAEVHRVREAVGAAFDEVFVGPALPEERHDDEVFSDLWQGRTDAEATESLLYQSGFEAPGQARDILEQLRGSLPVRRMGERGRQRLDRLMPSVLQLAAGKLNPVDSLRRMSQVVEAIARRTAYLALLVENPQALEHLGRLCSASPWIADRIARHPLLLDELIDPRIFQQIPAPEDYERELDEWLAACGDDLERLMDALREFQQASVLRIAAADISGSLDAEQVSQCLTLLAELILKRSLDIARQDMIRRHGRPLCHDPEPRESGFIIVAYGKLGSAELAYGSDLDLVFLHDSRGEAQQTDGDRSIDNGLFFARLAQRIIHQLATPTAAGRLYEVDTRLRPSGSAGLLVSGLEAFVDYQRDKAWTWEHQSLLRARAVAGEPALREAFEQARREVLARPRDEAELAEAIRDMRQRMLESQQEAAGRDLKRDPGGLVDVEFLVQYLVLRHARAHPELLAHTGMIDMLEALGRAGCLSGEDVEVLIHAARLLRARLHADTLAKEATAGTREGEASAELAAAMKGVADLWERVLGEAP